MGKAAQLMTSDDRRPIIGEDEQVWRVPKYAPRPNPLPIPTAGIFDSPCVCFSINAEWAGHFLGVMDALDQPDAWVGTDAEIDAARNQVREALLMLMGGGVCCEEQLAALTELVTLNTTMVANLTTIISNQTTVINQGDTNNLNQLITQFNQYQTINQSLTQLNQMVYDGTPQSIAPNIGSNWDGAADDAGNGALCAAIKRYVESCIYNKTNEVIQDALAAGAVSNALIAICAAAAVPSLGVSAAIGAAVAVANLAIGLGIEAWNESVHDPEAKRKVECCMYDALKGQSVTQTTFKASVNDCAFDVGTNESNIAAVVNDANQLDDNYLALLRSINGAPDNNDADCLCDCDDDVVLEDYAGTGCVITPIGNCIYRFVSSGIPAGDGFEYMSFRDIMSRCLHVENSPDPAHPTQGVGHNTTVTDCAGTVTNFTGGFAPADLRSVRWMEGGLTYYKITLAE